MNTTVLSADQEVVIKYRTLAAVVAITASTATPATAQTDQNHRPDVATVELARQIRNPKVQTVAYWENVAICESSKNGVTADWRDGGRFAGGLGIYVGTWRNYGGRQFAPTPAKASKTEQIVIANRISVLGHQTVNEYMTLADRQAGRTYFRPPSGFNGWGCIRARKSLTPKRNNPGGNHK